MMADVPGSDLLSGILGAVLGALATVFVTERAHKHNMAVQEWQANREVHGVLEALDTELVVTTEAYSAVMGSMIDAAPEGKPFFAEFDPQMEYSLTYKNNLHVIGRLENEPLRKLIINTHLQWAFLFELLYSNSRATRRQRDWALRGVETKDSELKQFYAHVSDGVTERLKEMPARLKKQQALCKELTARQTREIADYRIAHPLTKPRWFDFYEQ